MKILFLEINGNRLEFELFYDIKATKIELKATEISSDFLCFQCSDFINFNKRFKKLENERLLLTFSENNLFLNLNMNFKDGQVVGRLISNPSLVFTLNPLNFVCTDFGVYSPSNESIKTFDAKERH